ncbi:MAG: WcaI family glycosyltransferase [Opitutaceae bacterium]|nr:WcaI family glycosyltransferase [Verrucomicrobiales bacterium]
MTPRHFIVWGINYAPELTGIAPYNTALCEFLSSQGHRVSMVTSFSYYPEWRKRAEDRRRWSRTDVAKGVSIHRCWHYVPGKPSTVRRILHELSFVTTSLLRILVMPKPDAYVVVSPPLLLGFAAWVASVLKRAPFVFHVQDLQPDTASSMGMLRSGPLLKALYALESLAYRKASRVSGISPGMIRAFERKGVPRAKTLLFPNGVQLKAREPLPQSGAFRERLGICPTDLLAVYSGNLGAKLGVEILLESARFLEHRGIRIVICGDGARRQALEKLGNEMKLTNVIFLPLQPEKEYLEMMEDADVYLVTQLPGSGSLFFPSKLLKGLALSKAIVVVADDDSELTRSAREGRFALVVDPRHPERLANALEHLAKDPEQRRALGRAGRIYVDRFEQKYILSKFEHDLIDLVEETRQGKQLVPVEIGSQPAARESIREFPVDKSRHGEPSSQSQTGSAVGRGLDNDPKPFLHGQ